jgi:hypothetical protein
MLPSNHPPPFMDLRTNEEVAHAPWPLAVAALWFCRFSSLGVKTTSAGKRFPDVCGCCVSENSRDIQTALDLLTSK